MDNIKKYSYNPFNGDFFDCGYANHAKSIYAKGKQSSFDEYIRFIVADGILFIRTFYPFNDIDKLTADQIREKSLALLKEYKAQVKKILKKHNISYKKIVINAEQDLLKSELKTICI
jgi:hypothetical protein